MIKQLQILLLLLTPFILFGSGFNDQKRSEYLYTIPQYVTWPSQTDSSSFKIGLLAKDTVALQTLKGYLQSKEVKSKPISVTLFPSIEQIEKVDLIYFHMKDSINPSEVYALPEMQHTLLVTENYQFQKSMFNFIVVNNSRKFEINDKRLTARGFSVDPLFKAMSIKSKADWEQLYEKAEYQLEQERIVIREQTQKLKQQQRKISAQTEQIATQQADINQQTIALANLRSDAELAIAELQQKEDEIEKRKSYIITQKKEEILLEQEALRQKSILKELDSKVEKQKNIMLDQMNALERQKLIIGLFTVLSILVCVSAFFIFKAFQIKKRSHKLLEEKNSFITNQNEEITQQRDKIAIQNEEITDSIQYASKIQSAILPSHSTLTNAGVEHFILYKPRDIVSGDFYWASKRNDYLFFAGADCTGHGVPGAFMSMLGISFLNDIVNNEHIYDTGKILTELRSSIVSTLNTNEEENQKHERKDGMDMGLCRLDLNSHELQFSGAYNHGFLIRDNELSVIKADKMPVGLSDHMDIPFSNSLHQLQKGDTLYLYSDGYPDQFGGPKGKKFMSKRFKQLLVDINKKPMSEQKENLDKAINDWMSDTEQIDDILVMGVRI